MRCLRCKGMTMEERIETCEGSALLIRCLQCGDLVDSVVLYNRLLSLDFLGVSRSGTDSSA
ncbi:MAG: hypothetical protein ACE5GK_04465 [Nitrospiria bacterium]